MTRPYLGEPDRAQFDAWLEAARGRFMPPLTFPEVRKGVRALSALYVEKRAEGSLASRAVDGAGKRAAFATCYAPLHFLTLHHALPARAEWIREPAPRRRVVDLGCGTGAAGAAVARALAGPARLLGIDRSGWALGEARLTYSAFGLPARTVRGDLARSLPRARAGDLWVAGWSVNECSERSRADLLRALIDGVRAGVRVVVAEPLAGPATPWWDEWRRELGAIGLEATTFRVALELPDWLRKLDVATGLDHRTLGARLLCGPR